jgi:succinyl-CoA synthetase beta subunit
VADSINQKTGKGCVVKAQILGGGRGRGHFKENEYKGGVHVAKSSTEAKTIAENMLGYSLVTKQSGPSGMKCNAVYLVQLLDIEKEMYLAFTLDREASAPVLVYSPEGGMAIEDVAEATPDKIFKAHVSEKDGFTDEQINEIIKNLSLENHRESATRTLHNLYTCFHERDSDMIEINPMVVDKNLGVLCADSKITIDDNAAYRQPDLVEMEDTSGRSINEKVADKYHLNYIPIGGNIGCLVNGAGLAMATMDLIKYYGGEPANFLDVGGGAVGEQMNQAIHLLCDDDSVKVVYINIFGGILRCDLLVESIIKANEEKSFSKPIVLRLNGNKAEEAKAMLKGKEENLGIHFEADFDSSAQLAVKMAKR